MFSRAGGGGALADGGKGKKFKRDGEGRGNEKRENCIKKMW